MFILNTISIFADFDLEHLFFLFGHYQYQDILVAWKYSSFHFVKFAIKAVQRTTKARCLKLS